MQTSSILVTIEPVSGDLARWCVTEYFKELATLFEEGFDPGVTKPATDAQMTPPAGYFFVAWLDGQPAGGCGLRLDREGGAELKRMWTAPFARGRGVAHSLLDFAESTARRQGVAKLRLDTNRALTRAQALYRRAGFVEIAPYNEEPYADHWFEKSLTP